MSPPPDIVVPRAPSARDPALLQLDTSDGDAEWLRLTVYPVSITPLTVTLHVAMPRFERLAVYVGGHPRDQLLAADVPATTPDDSRVDSATALVADRALYAAPDAPAATTDDLARRFTDVLHGQRDWGIGGVGRLGKRGERKEECSQEKAACDKVQDSTQ